MRPAHKMRTIRGRGFTLTEVMVAIAVLLIVIVATGKIFGTASQVTGIGQATAGVLAEAAAFERRLREDISRLSTDGFFAVRNVAVPNDINLPGPLLDPRLPDDAVIRADQLVFFTSGVTTTQVFASEEPYADRSQQALATRVYYGHGFQVPELAGCQDPRNTQTQPSPYAWYRGSMVPWFEGTVPWITSRACTDQSTVIDEVEHAQVPAYQWLLSRQQVLMADDGGGYDRYFLFIGNQDASNSVEWLFDDLIRYSRRDIAARYPVHVRRDVLSAGNPGDAPEARWVDQRNYLERFYLFYPRAERFVPDMPREDLGLTTNVISSACSSVQIEWTYRRGRRGFDSDGDGLVDFFTDPIDVDGDGAPEYFGHLTLTGDDLRWFGLRGDRVDDLDADPFSGGGSLLYSDWQAAAAGQLGLPLDGAAIFPQNIEWTYNFPASDNDAPTVYAAIFGFNRAEALNEDDEADPDMLYTPWPSAIRVTLTLHDPDNRLAAGRRYQFIVDLPRRVEE